MADALADFAKQMAYLADVHSLADRALELGGEDNAATMLFSAAIVALNRTMPADQAIEIARVWTTTLEKAEWDAWH
jgi:hypothetical protein